MPKSKNPSKLPIVLIFLSSLFLSGSLNAQSEPTRESKGLQEQINELKEAQKAVQKDLQEIKGLLQGRGATPNLPPANLTLSVRDTPSKGNNKA